ncbi:hypothetical protein AVEN_1045-1 [Araneus ventricosus]|uniref:Uncharacterized protein n=1 Tax=Araneus ventricosus TaxID=182803 RepID=A0A4Y2R0K2_ARAVE|nr:hypothetical protein AVEN_1045-1 [Araneus ventricosus]
MRCGSFETRCTFCYGQKPFQRRHICEMAKRPPAVEVRMFRDGMYLPLRAETFPMLPCVRSGQMPSRCCRAEVSRRGRKLRIRQASSPCPLTTNIPEVSSLAPSRRENRKLIRVYACYDACYENDGKVLTACMEDDATYIVTCCPWLQDYEENQREWSPLNLLVYFQAKVSTRSPHHIKIADLWEDPNATRIPIISSETVATRRNNKTN